MTTSITAYSRIKDDSLSRNGEELCSAAHASFLQDAYAKLGINYPKFYKMDNLSKTGFLAAEVLMTDHTITDRFAPEEIGIVVSSANSSLDTDYRYGQTSETAPSPSLFVYTLPNIVIGELCIRHRIKGESACFVFDIFDAAFQTNYINTLFETGKVKACIGGWADYLNGKFEAFFYLVEKREGISEHNAEEVSRLYNI